MLKPDPTTTNYIFKRLLPGILSSWGCLGRNLGGIVNCYYNLLLYNAAATSAALLVPFLLYKLLADSSPMLQDSSEDASLR